MDTTNISANHKAIIGRTPIQVGSASSFNALKRAGFQAVIEMTFTSGRSNKFYRIETQRSGDTIRRWGRIGTWGQQKDFGSTCWWDTLDQKVRKGYSITKPTGSFPVRISEVRSNGDKLELVDANGNIVWSDTPISALKVLAVCSL